MQGGGSHIARAGALLAHESFYKAFATRDIEAKDAIWARECGVTCIHPRWPPLFDRRQIMESWVAIFESSDEFHIRPHDPRYHSNDGWLNVICFEELGEMWLAATNIYVWEEGVLKIAHHQAGPTSGEPPVGAPPDSDMVH